jgi:hypothetical protein
MDNLCCPKCNSRIVASLEGIKGKPHRSVTTKNLDDIFGSIRPGDSLITGRRILDEK